MDPCGFHPNPTRRPVGGKALAGMVAKNRGVEELSIGLNKIGDDAANEFIKSIAGNPVIRFIRIVS